MKAINVLVRLSIALLFGLVGVCAGCAAETDGGAHRDATLRPELVSQRVTAVVRRQSRQLLYLDTERQSFVTTPEHPFATVDSGWVPARELVPGDRVISAKFGSLRVSSVRIEARAEPVPVFNLSVERSHAYLVGNSDVLVHNTKCGGGEDIVTRKTREIAEAEHQLDALKNAEPPPEQLVEHQKQIDELKTKLTKLKQQLSREKSKAKAKNKARQESEGNIEASEDTVTRKSREVEETQGQLDALNNTEPPPEQVVQHKERIAELKTKLRNLKHLLAAAKRRAKGKTRVAEDETQQPPEGDFITRKSREVEEVRLKIDALENTAPTSREHALELKKQIDELKSKLRALLLQLRPAISRQKRKTNPELIRPKPEAVRGEDLRNELAAAQAELHELQRARTDTGDPAAAPGPREVALEKVIREHIYELQKDDELRELENRLAALEESARASNEPRPELESEKKKLRELIERSKTARAARKYRRKRSEDSETRDKDREAKRVYGKRIRRSSSYLNDPNRPRDAIERLEEELAALEGLPSSPSRDWQREYAKARLARLKQLAELRSTLARLRVYIHEARKRRETLVQQRKETQTADERLAALDRQRTEVMQQIARERAREILDGNDREDQNTQQTELSEQEFLAQLMQEIEHEQVARQGLLAENIHHVDDEMRFVNELLADTPSPRQAEEVHSALGRLESELQAERAQFDDNQFALTNEYAHLNETGGSAQRIAEIQAQQRELQATRNQNTQRRLEEIRRHLDRQEPATFGDGTIEAELAQQMARLEDELRGGS